MSTSSRSFRISIVWQTGPVVGSVELTGARVRQLQIQPSRIAESANAFACLFAEPVRLRLRIELTDADRGKDFNPPLVTVRTKNHPFTFFLRDVNADFPIFIPEYGVAVTAGDDPRTFQQIAEAIRSRRAVSQLQQIEADPEETYENACFANRDQMCPTWLGVSRDMRIFHVAYTPEAGHWGYIEPRYHSRTAWWPTGAAAPGGKTNLSLPPIDAPASISFCIGRGAACRVAISRRLEDGVLPILHSTQAEEDVTYQLTAFATLENQPLSRRAVRGTDWRAGYANTGGHMLGESEIRELAPLLHKEMYGRDQEIVCCIHVRAINSAAVPRYAWFKALAGQWSKAPADAGYFGEAGFSESAGRVYGINRLNSQPMAQPEAAILLGPGQSATFDMFVPHQPVSRERARRLARLDFDAHLAACRRFWRAKLKSAAQVRVPEPAIDERIRAGLLHCDLVAIGREPAGDVLATIGWYSPIGSESSPIIQFFDSMGWHRLAERSIQFFLDRQRPDGFIQNFAGYQLETGAVLWTMGEHFRYTRDRAWVRRVRLNILRACDYLLKWRDRNKRPELRGCGYGLADGKVADPDDFFHSFMLNGLSYVGIARSAEMLAEVDPANSRRLAAEAKAYRRDIRTAFAESMARSPVIPTGDGSWVPTAPPWAEYRGPVALYATGGNWWTHGSFGARDSLIGPLILVLCEVLDPDQLETTFMLRAHQELFTVRNAGLSQPYYCRHDYIHLTRGECKPFLKTYYNQFTALQDRETYTFWEHYFHASQHKTHEEAWFLMQTRWMLWHEQGDTLNFLSMIPRRWLQDGKEITLANVATYFGPATLHVRSNLARGWIEATVECLGLRRGKPRLRVVRIRLPHPENRLATHVTGGEYCPQTETVEIAPFCGEARVTVQF